MNRMPAQYTLVWDGSEVAAIQADGSDVLIRLSAAAVQVQASQEMGYLRPLVLRISNAAEPSHASDCFGALSDGCVTTADQTLRALPLPCHVTGAVSVHLQFKARDALVLQGTALQCTPDEGCVYAESYAC